MLHQFFYHCRAYFELDHRQTKTYLWLLCFTSLVLCSPLFTYYFYPVDYSIRDIQFTVIADSMDRAQPKPRTEFFQKLVQDMKEEDWIKTGLPSYLAKRIVKYQRKVKPIVQVKELYAIYGMDSLRIQQVLPYLLERHSKQTPVHRGIENKKQKAPLVLLDINTMDSVELEALPAIGPVLSRRILKYRTLLNGYVRKEQYAEVYGITPDALEVLQKRTAIKNLPIVCTLRETDYQKLNAHFYLTGKDARYISGQLKLNAAICWDELKNGLESKAQAHVEELKLYYPCQ